MKNKSIITDRMDRCLICGTYFNIHIHHVFFGSANRKLSEKYRVVVPLCSHHHNGSNAGVHFNRELDLKLKQLGQRAFEFQYPDLDFISVFGRNYL